MIYKYKFVYPIKASYKQKLMAVVHPIAVTPPVNLMVSAK